MKLQQTNSLNAERQEASTLLSGRARGINEARLDEVLQIGLDGHHQTLGPTPEMRMNTALNNTRSNLFMLIEIWSFWKCKTKGDRAVSYFGPSV